MDVDRARAFLLALPHVTETMQWGDNLVFWVGDKKIGGKMFCLIDLAADNHGVVSFAAGPERFAELQEQEDFFPAPYFARAHWIAANQWSAARNAEWEDILRHAHSVVYAKLPKRTLAQLETLEETQVRPAKLSAKAEGDALPSSSKNTRKKRSTAVR